MSEYPVYTVKVIIETAYRLTNSHDSRVEQHIQPTLKFYKEIDAFKAAMDSLLERYRHLEKEECEDGN